MPTTSRDFKAKFHYAIWLEAGRMRIYTGWTSHKLCLLVFKCLHGLAPRYLAELCVPVADVTPRRKLRSATRGLLDFPRYSMKNYGRRTFSYAGLHAWNSLPEHLRQCTSIALFKRSLKTFLFEHMSRSAH